MEIIDSFPSINEEQLQGFEKRLMSKFGFPELPNDYKAFLLQHNGGFVSPGSIDETDEVEHTHEVVFNTPLKWVLAEGQPMVRPSLYCFFAAWLEDEMDEDNINNYDLYTIETMNVYSREDFEVLPTLMMSIGMSNHHNSGDLIIISLEEDEYGAVYYSFNNAENPANYHGDYYDKAAQVVIDKYKLTPEIYNNLQGEAKTKMVDAFKKTYFAKVADSFTEFINQCEIIKVDID